MVTAVENVNASGRISITGDRVRIRATPSLKGKVLGYANTGDVFYSNGFSRDYSWYRISYRGKTAWISAQYVLPFN